MFRFSNITAVQRRLKYLFPIHSFCSHANAIHSTTDRKPHIFSYYSYCIPKEIHVNNKNYAVIHNNYGFAGEDSYFALKHKHSPHGYSLFIGVADGVGSISNPINAENSARFAQTLMQSSLDFINKNETNIETENISYEIASHSANIVTNELQIEGASTLCTLAIIVNDETNINGNAINGKMTERKTLYGWNLGDSGFCIFRRNPQLMYDLIYSTHPQIQGIGIPYQLGTFQTANSINDGYGIKYELQSTDIIIVASDGIWDNLYEEQISDIIANSMKYYDMNTIDIHTSIARNGHLTQSLIKEALVQSRDQKIATPWSEMMTEEMDMIYNGGKPDDMTCIVCYIH